MPAGTGFPSGGLSGRVRPAGSGRKIGGYLTKPEKKYEVISKRQPLFEKSSAKNLRYVIGDNFFTFWFRFIYKYSHMPEIENHASVKMITDRDYETFSGLTLEHGGVKRRDKDGKRVRIPVEAVFIAGFFGKGGLP